MQQKKKEVKKQNKEYMKKSNKKLKLIQNKVLKIRWGHRVPVGTGKKLIPSSRSIRSSSSFSMATQVVSSKSPSSSKGWNISSIAARIYLLIIIFQVPLFRYSQTLLSLVIIILTNFHT